MFFYAFIVFDITTVYVIYLDRMFNNILNRFFKLWHALQCISYHDGVCVKCLLLETDGNISLTHIWTDGIEFREKEKWHRTGDILRGRRGRVSKSGGEIGRRGCWKTEEEGGMWRTNCCFVRTINGRKLSNIPNRLSVKTNGLCDGDTGLLNPPVDPFQR